MIVEHVKCSFCKNEFYVKQGATKCPGCNCRHGLQLIRMEENEANIPLTEIAECEDIYNTADFQLNREE